ncbi:MAG: DUF177 domain-containing protein [Gammaproteobacteria bacterium]|nr:DUF177 domain-containing protein [Gammaproteobacteria bacterium]
MLNRIPKDVDYYRFTDARKSIQGEILLKHCHRLMDSIILDENAKTLSIKVDLDFGIDDFGHRFMSGKISTNVDLECQRCMQPMALPIDLDIAIAVIRDGDDEAEDAINGIYEPYFIADKTEPFPLFEYIEDELLLALPLIAKHEKDCVKLSDYNDNIEEEFEQQLEQKVNPFEVLKHLKN